MSFHIQKTPQARADLTDIASFIAKDNSDFAERFLTAAEAAFDLLASMPLMGRMIYFKSKSAQNIWLGHVQGFERYLIFYRTIEQGVEIVRVLHGARDIARLFDE